MTDQTNEQVPAPVLLTAENIGAILSDVPASFRLILRNLLSLKRGILTVALPDGQNFQFRARVAGPSAHIQVRSWSLSGRMVLGGSLGLAEGYIEGEWDSPDVTAVLELFCRNEDISQTGFRRNRILNIALQALSFLRRNTKHRSRKNIAAHYDLGNEFYRHWLDDTMTYSSGIFSGGENDLRSAQLEKYRSLARMMELESRHSILEVGCGWGAFAEFAAKEIGCKVTGLTISRGQYDYARQRISEAGLNEKVEIMLQDYRDESGLYDRIASIEMFEAVGEKFWPVYFNKLNQNLRRGGIAGLQVITIPERFFADYRRNMDFIQRYIFPGGMLPTPGHLSCLADRFGFSLTSERIFGQDYATTLAEWRQRFAKAWPEVRKLGFDERFRRMWNYYFHYCEAGFQTDCLDVRQMALRKH